MPEMATPAKQALQGSEAEWGHETQRCRGAPTRTTSREPKATRALLQFLANTCVALPQGYLQRAVERARKDKEWGLEALAEAVRTGEG